MGEIMRDYHFDSDPKELSSLQIMFALRDRYDEAIDRGFGKELDRRLATLLYDEKEE